MEGSNPRRGRGRRHAARPWSRRLAGGLVATVVGLTTACSRSDDDGIDEQPVIEIGQTGVGTCLRFAEDVGDTITELPVVPCDESHTHEIFAVVTSGEDVYPGFDALEETALTECLAAFEDYVGIGPFDSSLFTSWLVPTLDSWNDDEDRETICVAGNGDAAPLTATVAGSGR